MFTCFCNKFRPVNCMHYIKCGVNSSLHNSGCCRRSVAPWITVLSQHTVFTMGVIYKFNLVLYSAKQGSMHMHTSHMLHLYAVPFLWPWDEHRRQWSWVDDFANQCWLLQFPSHTAFVAAAFGLPTILGVGWSWLFSASSIKFLTRRSLISRWVYLAPHEDNSIQLLSNVKSRRWKNKFVVHFKVCRIIE